MTDNNTETDVARRYGYHPLRVVEVIDETDDTRSYVLRVPADVAELFTYQAGQFCTFRTTLNGEELFRCYSMSSAPADGSDLTVTVKRVPGGKVSNWFNDHVAAGDTLDVMKPGGTFCLRPNDRPIVAFCGGSGVTPVLSIAKTALTRTDRSVTMVYANRNPSAVIFSAELDRLSSNYPSRFSLTNHVDSERGFLTADDILGAIDSAVPTDYYICGPTPFMDLVETTLLDAGVSASDILIERFGSPADSVSSVGESDAAKPPSPSSGEPDVVVPETIMLIVKKAKKTIAYRAGDTVLLAARSAGIQTPFSCEAGTCATCMALVKQGSVTMRTNQALTPSELDEGWVLTCQAVPTSTDLIIEFDFL